MKEVVKPTTPHKHSDYFELIFLNKGSGTHTIDETLYQVSAPDIFFLRPNQTHCWDFSSIPQGYVLLFKEEIFNNKSVRDLLYQMPSYLRLKQDSFVEVLFTKMIMAEVDADLIGCYVHILLHYILQDANIDNTVAEGLFHDYKKMIDVNFKELKFVNYYAQKLNVTSQKLNDVCKKVTGKTAQDLIKERIFIESKVLLTHTSKSIKEIAMDLGFNDSPHFNKFFSANANITPGRYRKHLNGF